MHALLMAAQAASSDDGLTFAEVVTNIPHDPAAVFTYVLLIVTYGSIFWVGRSRKAPPAGRA